MKEIIDQFPLFGSIIGFLLTASVLFNKHMHKGNSTARYYLAAAIFLTTLNLIGGLDSQHVFADWICYFFYPLIGFAYMIYAQKLMHLEINIRKWGVIVGSFTLVHILILLSFVDLWMTYSVEDLEEVNISDVILIVDYYAALFINLFTVYIVFKRFKKISCEDVELSDHLNLVWLKKIFGSITLIYFSVLLLIMVVTIFEVLFNPLVMGIEMGEMTGIVYDLVIKLFGYEKMESFLTSLFIFSIAVWSMKIPVFSNYQAPKKEKETKKYASSTLKNEQSIEIWDRIISLMENQKLYRNPTLRLNDLVNEIGKPLPHISQVINEQMNMSFLDFVNQYRVKEAKELLCDEKSKSMTILAIAYEVGFNSKTTFYTSFKKVTGQTPSEYKKANLIP